MKDLIIIGAGGHGKVLENIAKDMKKWNKVFFLDDDSQKNDKQIVGTIRDYPKYLASCDFIVGIGDNGIRQKIHNLLESEKALFATLIHPFSYLGSNVTIGCGTSLMPGVVVNCNTYIEKGCIINTGACIDHDCIISEFVHISPGTVLGGNVRIDLKTWMGIGSRIINNTCVTKECIIGAGAVVVRDILIPGTYIGIPARLKNS